MTFVHPVGFADPMNRLIPDRLLRALCTFAVTSSQMKIPKAEPGPAEVLYRRGRTSTMCTLILTGKANIIAGKDGEFVPKERITTCSSVLNRCNLAWDPCASWGARPPVKSNMLATLVLSVCVTLYSSNYGTVQQFGEERPRFHLDTTASCSLPCTTRYVFCHGRYAPLTLLRSRRSADWHRFIGRFYHQLVLK